MARSPEASPQSPSSAPLSEAGVNLQPATEALTASGATNRPGESDGQPVASWKPEDQVAAIMDARSAVSAANPTSQEPDQSETSHHPMATGGQWSHVPKSGASPAVEGPTEDLRALKPGASAVHKPSLGILRRAANWLGLVPESNGVNTYVSPPAQQEPAEGTGEVLTGPILPPAGEWPSPAIDGSDEEAAGSPSPTDEVVAGAPSSELPEVPVEESPVAVGGLLARVKQWRKKQGGSGALPTPPPSAKRLPVQSTASPSPQSPAEPTPWHASPTSPGEATSPSTPNDPNDEPTIETASPMERWWSDERVPQPPVPLNSLVEKLKRRVYGEPAVSSTDPTQAQENNDAYDIEEYFEHQRDLHRVYQKVADALSNELTPNKLPIARYVDAERANKLIALNVVKDWKPKKFWVDDALKIFEADSAQRDLASVPRVMLLRHASILKVVSAPKIITTLTGPNGEVRTLIGVATKSVDSIDYVEDAGKTPLNIFPPIPVGSTRDGKRTRWEKFDIDFFTVPGTVAELDGVKASDLTIVPMSRVSWGDENIRAGGLRDEKVTDVVHAASLLLGVAAPDVPQRGVGVPSSLPVPRGAPSLLRQRARDENQSRVDQQRAAEQQAQGLRQDQELERAAHVAQIDQANLLRELLRGSNSRPDGS